MARLTNFLWFSVLLSVLSASEPVFIRNAKDAEASPYDNLLVGVPSFTDYVADRLGFCTGFSRKFRQPLWIQYRLTAEEVQNKIAVRSSRFYPDKFIPGSASPKDYIRTGFDRGHMAAAADMRWSEGAMKDSFAMTNISPQHPDCNRKIWKDLEELTRRWALREKELYVICGPLFFQEGIAIGNGTIPVPRAYFRIICDMTPPRKMIAFIVPNQPCSKSLKSLVVSVDLIEALTGYDFFSRFPAEVQKELQEESHFNDWE